MIITWTSVGPVIARITRNIKHTDADYMAELPEWIAEAIGKLQTHYTLTLGFKLVDINYHLAEIPCHGEGVAAVTYGGKRLLPSDEIGPLGGTGVSSHSNDLNGAFRSVINFPKSVTKLEQTDINNWPFYLNTVESLGDMPVDSTQFYRVRYNKIETSAESGKLGVYYWTTPTDDDGFPMIPNNENYKTAVYWYCRAMMIGAGFEDKVFSYETCDYNFEKFGDRAICEITYPTVDEKMRNIINNVKLIPSQYSWETFGGEGAESSFID